MAYQARRSRKLYEEFELVDENGDVVHTLKVSLDADDMVVAINRKYTALTRALTETTEAQRKAKDKKELEECMETLGRAVLDLIEAVFGEENGKVLVDFYEGRYLEMSREVLPFISQVVIPRLVEIRKENQKSMFMKYNRQQRRHFLKR